MTPDILLHVLSRFIHISSAILLLGGVFYARQVLVPTLAALPAPQRETSARFGQSQFQGVLWTLLALSVLSGLYNFFTGPKHTPSYHMWFGIKMLLVLHILATAILWAVTPYKDETSIPKTGRRLLSLVISGFVVVLISAYLRSLTQRGL